MALNWLKSYLENQHQFVKLGQHSSETVRCTSGAPLGLVLGPLIFAAYVSPIGDVINSHGVDHHQYADDTRLYLAISNPTTSADLSILESVLSILSIWFSHNWLAFNPEKISFITLRYMSMQSLSHSHSVSNVSGSAVQLADHV